MGDGQNIFDKMIANGGKVPAGTTPTSPAPSPQSDLESIPAPVVSPYLNKQTPDQQASQVTGVPTHLGGTATVDQLRAATTPAPATAPAPAPAPAPAAAGETNVFDRMIASKQPKPAVVPPETKAESDKKDRTSVDNMVQEAWGLAGKAVSHIPDWMVPAQALQLKQLFQEHPAEVAGVAKQMAETPLVNLEGAGTYPAKILETIKQNRESGRADLEGLPPGMIPSDAQFEEQVKEDFPNVYGVGKGVANLVSGLTSPENIAILAAMPEAKAAPLLSKLASYAFALQMGPGAFAKLDHVTKNWFSMKPAERAEELTDAIGGAVMTAGALKHGAVGEPVAKTEAKPEVSKRTILRPTTKTVAGVEVPITAKMQEKPGVVTRAAEALTTPGEARTFQTERTKPAATRAAVSALSLSAEQKIAQHNALVDGVPAPEGSTDDAPGKYTTPDQITDALRATANRTYDKAREMSIREQADWQQRYAAAVAEHRQGVDEHNQKVADWNKENPDNPLEPMGVDVRPESLGLPERPQTFDEIRTAIEDAKARTDPRRNSPDVVTKARDVELPKAEKAEVDWFKEHEDQIPKVEYDSAKSLWRDAARFNDIANNIRRKIVTNSLTGNDIRGLEPLIDGKARRWNQAAGTGTFARLVGDETKANLESIAKLFDPLDKSDPRANSFMSWGSLAIRHVIRLMLGEAIHGPAGAVGAEAVGTLGEKLFNHIMFDPEFGTTFRDLTDATKDYFEKGTAVPRAILARMSQLVQSMRDKRTDLGKIQPTMADMRTAGPNYEEDLRAQAQAAKERDEGTLPEGMSFLQRAQQLKDQYIAERPERRASGQEKREVWTPEERAKALGRIAEVERGLNPNPYVRNPFDVKAEPTVRIHHWSDQPDLTEANPEKMGTGSVVGEERARMGEPGFQKTAAFGTSVYREPRIQSRPYHYVADVNPREFYDIDSDPEGIWKSAANPTAAEKAVRDAGYKGYSSRGQYRSFEKVPVKPAGTSDVTSGELANYFNKNRGFTLNGEQGFMKDKPGYSVAGEYKNLDQVFPGDSITAKQIEEYRNRPEVKEALKDPKNSIGGWFYKGNAYLEISRLFSDKDAAIAAAKKMNQTAIFDHANKEEIPTGGTAGEEAAAGLGNVQTTMAPIADKTASEITTRRPKAVGADLSNKPGQNSDWDAIQQADENKPSGKTAMGGTKMGYKEKLARTVSQYPGMFANDEERLEALKNPQAVLEKFVNHVANNLEWLYNQVPPEIREMTRQWYDNANRVLEAKAKKYGYTHEQAAGVTAALSPQNPWDNNLGLADRMMDIYKNRQNQPFTPEMEQVALDLKKVPTQSKAFKGMLKDIAGKKLKDVKNANPNVQAAQRALWVRVYDEAHGVPQNDQYAPTGEVTGHSPDTRSWIGLDHGAKAIKILDNGSVDNINAVMGGKHKIRNFYNNLINPNSMGRHATIDTHAVGAGLLMPMGGDDTPAKHNFGSTNKGVPGPPGNNATGLSGTYALYHEAYGRVADKLGILPRELQSITWEAIKSLMGDEKKTPELKSQAKDIWQQVAEGALKSEDAREQIKEAARGFSKPAWMSDEQWEKIGQGQPGEDTSFNPETMQETNPFGFAEEPKPRQPRPAPTPNHSTDEQGVTTLGKGEHQIAAKLTFPERNLSPEQVQKWKGQPEPVVPRTPSGRPSYSNNVLQDIADYKNVNAEPHEVVNSAAHEMAHAFLQHQLGYDTREMKVNLSHRPMRKGKPMGEGLGKAGLDGISGGFIHTGDVWNRELAQAGGQVDYRQAKTKVIKDYVTQLMAGAAMEELLGNPASEIATHVKGDVASAKSALKNILGVPSGYHSALLAEAKGRAKAILKENWATVKHMSEQAVNHYGGGLIDSATFHKYRNGGVYGQP